MSKSILKMSQSGNLSTSSSKKDVKAHSSKKNDRNGKQSYGRIKTEPDERPNLFDDVFYANLIVWEETFYCHRLSQEGVNQLVQAYGQLVEYFDSKKDPLKRYFLDKLQFTLSRPQIIKKIMKQQEEKIREQSKIQKFEQEIREQRPSFENLDSSYIANDTPKPQKQVENSPSYNTRSIQRAFLIQKELIYSNQKERSSMKELMDSFEKESSMIDDIHKSELHRQQGVLKEKILSRIKSIEKSPKCTNIQMKRSRFITKEMINFDSILEDKKKKSGIYS